MTNKEILHANLLDIVFDNRNKEYGAYALRRGYNKRMLLSLGAGLSVILFFIFFSMISGDNGAASNSPFTKLGHTVTVEMIPPEQPKEQPKPVQPKAEKLATVKYNTMKVVPDEQAPEQVTTQSALDGKQISGETSAGKETDGTVFISEPVDKPGTGDVQAKPEPVFAPSYSNPEYPGGQEALSRFLSQNLATPGDLEPGEKKMVKIRFSVDKDGAVTGFEIDQTGGAEYDREVIRVCKKMRRWKPARQNGVAVAVSYVLPVTFIGLEQ